MLLGCAFPRPAEEELTDAFTKTLSRERRLFVESNLTAPPDNQVQSTRERYERGAPRTLRFRIPADDELTFGFGSSGALGIGRRKR